MAVRPEAVIVSQWGARIYLQYFACVAEKSDRSVDRDEARHGKISPDSSIDVLNRGVVLCEEGPENGHALRRHTAAMRTELAHEFVQPGFELGHGSGLSVKICNCNVIPIDNYMQ